MENKTREEGHYWTKYEGNWIVCFYFEKYWYGTGSGESFEDKDFEEIDENRIVRQPTIKGNDLIRAIGNAHRIKGSDLIP